MNFPSIRIVGKIHTFYIKGVILSIIFDYRRIYITMILIFKHFFYKNYVGLSVWPFIFLKNDSLKEDRVLINHEKIHLRQQKELLIIPFYVVYMVEWLIRTLLYFDSYKAYKNISFEREAYFNEKNLEYLKTRATFSFIKYL